MCSNEEAGQIKVGLMCGIYEGAVRIRNDDRACGWSFIDNSVQASAVLPLLAMAKESAGKVGGGGPTSTVDRLRPES